MKLKIFILIICLISLTAFLHAEDAPLRDLDEISQKIEQYKNKTVTMILKLKYRDTVFEKIIFYDAKNHDIEFDYSTRELKRALKSDMINLHEGMEYRVTFIVKGTGNLGMVYGKLLGFIPALLQKLP